MAAPASADTVVSVETFRVPPRWLFVRVETAQGLVGWGEASLEGHTEAVEGALKDLAERLIGRDPGRIEDFSMEAERGRFYRGGPVLRSALSGIDICLWDILAKRHNTPVYNLLGGPVRNKISVYSWVGGDHARDVLDGAKLRKEQGFKAIKMNATGETICMLTGLDFVLTSELQIWLTGLTRHRCWNRQWRTSRRSSLLELTSASTFTVCPVPLQLASGQ